MTVDGMSAYKRSLTNAECMKNYSEGWDRIFGKNKEKTEDNSICQEEEKAFTKN
jgi:hypothetical protein